MSHATQKPPLTSERRSSKAKAELEQEDNTCMGQSSSCIPVPARRKKHRCPTVCITARSTTTLDAVENLVRATLGERVNIYTIHIQSKESISLLKKTVGSKTHFICCANYGHRLLLLSDTDPDELTEVVYHAGKISKYKKHGVMVLLFGHRNLTEGVYDRSTFDHAFMRSQPRLQEKAKSGTFISVYDSFNSDQEACLCRWIQVEFSTEKVEASEEDSLLVEDLIRLDLPTENVKEPEEKRPRKLEIRSTDAVNAQRSFVDENGLLYSEV